MSIQVKPKCGQGPWVGGSYSRTIGCASHKTSVACLTLLYGWLSTCLQVAGGAMSPHLPSKASTAAASSSRLHAGTSNGAVAGAVAGPSEMLTGFSDAFDGLQLNPVTNPVAIKEEPVTSGTGRGELSRCNTHTDTHRRASLTEPWD